MKKKLLLLLCTALIALSACAPNTHQYPDESNDPSTTCANITMGGGRFAYHNDFIYFFNYGNICEYDVQSKENVVIPTKNNIFIPSLYVDDDYIYFADGGLMRMTKNGKKTENIYKDTAGWINLYLTETYSYFVNGYGGSLYRRNLETGIEEELLSGIQAYHIDNNMIYAIAQRNDTNFLYQSKLDSINFEPVELSFQPIAVLAVNDTLFLSKAGTWEVIMYKDGSETTLPISSINYQVLDNNLFYISCYTDSLKSYNLETGEESTIHENTSHFCILKEKYIAIDGGYGSSGYVLYDLETQTLEQMYPQGGE